MLSLRQRGQKKKAFVSSFGSYHALVIGNQNYRHFDILGTPLNDARKIKQILKEQYSFKVTLLPDATREEILRALGELRRIIKKEDNLLVYYAGHGILDKVTDVGYWLPIDAEKDSYANWIPSTDLVTSLKGIQANHILVIADSCFSGALTTTRASGAAALDRGSEVWLRRMREKKSRTALTSGGGKEEVLDAGGGNHSIFAKSLIDVLRNNRMILDGQGLFDHVKRLVVANADQTPKYEIIRKTGHNFGDFLFVPKGFTSLPPVIPSNSGSIQKLRGAQQPIDQDKHDWGLLSKNGKSGLESYLALHRNGTYASEARSRLKQLQRRPVQASTTRTNNITASTRVTRKPLSKEQQAQALYEWQQDIIYANDSRTVEQFLQRFPTGSHVQDARSKLADLRAQGY